MASLSFSSINVIEVSWGSTSACLCFGSASAIVLHRQFRVAGLWCSQQCGILGLFRWQSLGTFNSAAVGYLWDTGACPAQSPAMSGAVGHTISVRWSFGRLPTSGTLVEARQRRTFGEGTAASTQPKTNKSYS